MTITKQRIEKSGTATTTSTTFTDTTGMTLTLANRSGGKFMATHNCSVSNNTQERIQSLRFVKGATNYEAVSTINLDIDTNVDMYGCLSMALTESTNGDTLKIQWKVSSNTGSYYGATDNISHIEVLEIS